MVIPYGPVSKLTPIEMLQLASWSFLSSYNSHHIELVNLAKGTYTATCHVLNAPPTQDQLYQPYWRSLRWTDLYRKRIAGGKAPPSLYDYYAGLLAKYVLEQDWGDISSASCP